MSRRYSLAPAARSDLREITQYIASESVDRAEHVARRLFAAMDQLASTPEIGHLREDLAAEPLRFWPVWPFLIVYRAESRPVEIVRVIHDARDVGSLLG